jgi:GT2 family glycosyltransferase
VSDRPPTVSVIIVNWNTRELLRACLDSLPWDSERVRIEAIVVDNASEDGSATMVAEQFPQARVLRNRENVGFVRANNQGLRAATGEFLFMLNSDTEVRPGAIERLVEVLAADERIGAVGPRLLNPDGTPQSNAAPFPSVIHRFLPARYESRYQHDLERRVQESPDHVAPVAWLAGAALMTRRDVLERVGPLDERYFMWYDDIDWCQKLRAAGYERVFVADAVVAHHGRRSGGRLASHTLAAQLFDSEYLYLRLHAGRLATCLVFALRIAKAALRWVIGPADARAEAAWRLGYHRRRLGRFCLGVLPADDTDRGAVP